MDQYPATFRRLTSSLRALPEFVIIGAMRAGTTSLFNYIISHPCAEPATEKEIHFFDLNYKHGMTWYQSHFPSTSYLAYKAWRRGCSKGLQTGEASPYYLFHPLAPERLADRLPSARLIVLLRDPVQRAYSHFLHEVKKGREHLSFEEAIKQEDKRLEGEEEKLRTEPDHYSEAHQRFSYLARGRYVDQLRAWLNFFPRKQLLVLKSEALFADPLDSYRRVLAFLDLPNWTPEDFPQHNANKNSSLKPQIRDTLRDYFESYNQELYKLIGQDFGW